MARRPENPRDRGRRSEGPLDWLNEADQADQPGPAPTVDAWRPESPAPAPRADPRARVDPGAVTGSDPRPRADPGAPLGRRAARAQREALAAEQARAAKAAGGRGRPAPMPKHDQTQVGMTGPITGALPWAGVQPRARTGRDQYPGGDPRAAGPNTADLRAASPRAPWPVDPGTPAFRTAEARSPEARSNQARSPEARTNEAWSPEARSNEARSNEPWPLDPGISGPRTAGFRTVQPGPAEPPPSSRPEGRQRAVMTPGEPGTEYALGPRPQDRHQDDEDHEDLEEPVNRPRRLQVALWLTLAALILAAWSATAFVDSGTFPIAGLATLTPLVSVLALPVIAVGVASKHLVPTAIAVVAALLPWTLVPGYASAGPGPKIPAGSATLRVMSIDGAEGQASAKDIVQATRLYSVDVVVVTDLTSEQTHDLTVAGLASLAPARWVDVTPGGKNGTGLWSRLEITDPTPITGLSRSGADGVIKAGSTDIGISVVHLAGHPLKPGASWRADLAELGSRTAPAPEGFIVGDLNASPWQPAFRRLTKSKWRDAADVVGQGLRPTWPSWSPLPIAPVDHVLASPGLGVVGADTANIAGSSHRALIVTLSVPGTDTGG